MVRWGRHSTVATGSDSADQVSVSQWNADLSTTGIFGFTKQAATISSNAIIPTGTVIEISATGTLSTITPTSNSEFDLIYILAASGATVTLTHDASGAAGKVRLLAGVNKTLSTTSPTILICRTIGANKEWIEYGGGITNSLDDVGDVTITSASSGQDISWNGSAWVNRTLATSATTDTTDASNISSGTLPLARLVGITNTEISSSAAIAKSKLASLDIVNADINSSAAIATSKIAGLATSATTDTTNASNISSGTLNNSRLPSAISVASLTLSGDLTVQGTTTTIDSTTINIQNAFVFEGATADAFETTLTTIDPTADRTVSLPDATTTLIGTDTTDTLTNKTINLTSNTLASTLAQLNTAVSDADVASLAGTETLTNKTLTSPVITYAINAQTGTTYTTVLADANQIITSSNASAVTITIPPNSSVAYAIGSSITVISIGAGLTSFAQGSGVTIASTGATSSAPVLREQHSSATAIKIATNTWQVVGDIS